MFCDLRASLRFILYAIDGALQSSGSCTGLFNRDTRFGNVG